jgi:hypothetical protein
MAVAIGLGTIDMPVPSVEEWEWLNWKFPRPIHAGDTIYARWTLTQKRPPVGGASTSIVVWRVDLHTVDGALCAEGEVGAKVRRHAVVKDQRPPEPASSAPAPRRRRGRRRPAAASAPALPEPPPIVAPPASVAKSERPAGPARRRRRRRPSSGSAVREGESPGNPASTTPEQPAPPPPATPGPQSPATTERGGLGSVIRRLRQPRRT